MGQSGILHRPGLSLGFRVYGDLPSASRASEHTLLSLSFGGFGDGGSTQLLLVVQQGLGCCREAVTITCPRTFTGH